MTLVEDGAENLIAMFGEEVDVVSMDNEVPDDPNDPMFIDSSGQEEVRNTHRVRLYTTPSKETLQEYGFDEDTESMMYSTDDVASEGDRVEYQSSTEWIVKTRQTNQIGNGPYIFVYALSGV